MGVSLRPSAKSAPTINTAAVTYTPTVTQTNKKKNMKHLLVRSRTPKASADRSNSRVPLKLPSSYSKPRRCEDGYTTSWVRVYRCTAVVTLFTST